MKRVLECVVNISEGRNIDKIEKIQNSITKVNKVKLLNVDIGQSANRTVMSFAGEPEQVCEAAFQCIKTAASVIDMSKHKGTHPRMGATDVCPLVPIRGITIQEAVVLANALAARVGNELQIPVYLYEFAAKTPERKSLANIRQGEYESFAKKIYLTAWKPDYGPQEFNSKSGQTVIGVRNVLVAFNVNLNTRSVPLAQEIAADVRESGRLLKKNGKVILSENGVALREEGKLKSVYALGWYIEEYGLAQVSMNLTDVQVTPLHIAYEAVKETAEKRGLQVMGSEIVGLVPMQCLIDAGNYYLNQLSVENRIGKDPIAYAIEKLWLNYLYKFDISKKIIENILAELVNE